jgi:hypothetical protein
MKATFEKAKVIVDGEDAFICLSIPYRDAKKFVSEMKPKKYTVEIKEHREKRSLDANAYYWLLCGELARTLNEPTEEIYRRHIRDISNYDVLCMLEEAFDEFAAKWTSNHLGRRIETRASKIPGCVTVLAYYGSSDFSRSEMTKLIDNCVQDCKAVGIETMTPAELARLTEEWR